MISDSRNTDRSPEEVGVLQNPQCGGTRQQSSPAPPSTVSPLGFPKRPVCEALQGRFQHLHSLLLLTGMGATAAHRWGGGVLSPAKERSVPSSGTALIDIR